MAGHRLGQLPGAPLVSDRPGQRATVTVAARRGGARARCRARCERIPALRSSPVARGASRSVAGQSGGDRLVPLWSLTSLARGRLVSLVSPEWPCWTSWRPGARSVLFELQTDFQILDPQIFLQETFIQEAIGPR